MQWTGVVKILCKPHKLEGAIVDCLNFEPDSFVDMENRDLQRFFDQVGHQTTNASIENKHFFTK